MPRSAREMRNPVPGSAEVLAEGRAHFADHCAICHGNDGRGRTPMDEGHVEVKTQEGKVIAARLTKDTKYFKGQEPATLADLKTGLRAALRVAGEGKTLTAGEVRLPSD